MPLNHGVRAAHEAVPQVAREAFGIEPPLEEPGREQRAELGREQDHPAVRSLERRVVERLDPEPVARDQHLAAASVVDREAVHAAQTRQDVGPEPPVTAEQHLGVSA